MSGIEALIRRYFPYDAFRRYQWEIAKTIYDALSSGKVTLIEAPTGVGKTASAWQRHWHMQRRAVLKFYF